MGRDSCETLSAFLCIYNKRKKIRIIGNENLRAGKGHPSYSNFFLIYLFNYQYLESHAKHESYAVLVSGRQVKIVETANVLDVQEFEDVMNTCHQLHVWAVLVHNRHSLREVHQPCIAGILLEEGVVLV